MATSEVPTEGKDLISVTEFGSRVRSYLSGKSSLLQAMLVGAMSWIRDWVGLEELGSTEDQVYSAVSSEMEMSVHGREQEGEAEEEADPEPEEEEEGEIIMIQLEKGGLA
jgi:hypothetical protein